MARAKSHGNRCAVSKFYTSQPRHKRDRPAENKRAMGRSSPSIADGTAVTRLS